MKEVKSVTDYEAQFKFEPPLVIPDEVPITGLVQVVSMHIANRESHAPIAGFVADQVGGVSNAAINNAERAQMLARMIGNGQQIIVS